MGTVWLLAAVAFAPAAVAQDGSPAASGPAASSGPVHESACRAPMCAPRSSRMTRVGIQRCAARSLVGRASALGRSAAALVEDDPYACRLPAWDPAAAWPFAGTVDAANAFHWAEPDGESTDPQGEIVGVGWAPVSLTKANAKALVKSKAFTTKGDAGKAIKAGDYVLIQIETAEAPAISADRNLSFHIGTDRHNDPGNNTPSSVEDPLSPYQDLQDVYTVYLVAGTTAAQPVRDRLRRARSAANGSPWYNGKTAFAARLTTEPPGVQFLLPAKAVGESFRPISSSTPVAGGTRGRLVASIAGQRHPAAADIRPGHGRANGLRLRRDRDTHGPVPARRHRQRDGRLPGRGHHPPSPRSLDSLTVNGQARSNTQMLSGTPLIWCTWPTFEDGDVLAAWFKKADPTGTAW